ncbi:sulfotransferase 1A1-like [Dermacentor albipictus]|uniref:sulfotransferase 1A1-like n=1 Tax=Dermacentor albipictus TaxID=60249 RepID=UPI0038FCE248
MSSQLSHVTGAMHNTHEEEKLKVNNRKKPNLMMVRGTPFASYFHRGYIESAMDYVHRQGGLFSVTYVKCGTTWMQHIVYLIQNGGVPPASAIEFYKASPYIEICGADCVQWVKRPGAIKTHLPLHQVRYSRKAKYIVVIRNPFDVLLSMHHFWFMISAYEYEGSFDDSFENFMDNYIECGDYFTFYRDWYKRSADRNVLFVVYEDVKKDPEAAILKVARFLGPEYEQRLLVNDGKVLKDVLKYSSVEEMKTYTNDMFHDYYAAEFALQGEGYEGLRKLHEIVHNARDLEDGHGACADKVYYVRKGVVGDYKNCFSPEQVERLKRRFQKETQGSGIANLWPDMGFHE